MTGKLLGVLAASLVVAAAASGNDAAKNLAQSIKKTATLEAYRFTTNEKPGKGSGGGLEGTYRKGQPVFFRADRIAFYQKGGTLIYQDAGRWHRSKTGTESDPLRVLGAVAKVRGVRLPHEELAGFEKHFKKVQKAAEKDKGRTMYEGDLTAAAVKRLAPSEFTGVARSGTAKLWVNANGLIVQYTIALRLQGRQGNAEVDGRATKTVSLDDLGSARVEVPKEARKILGK